MKFIPWLLGLVFGTLSVVMLMKHGFEVGFVSSLQAMLEFYEQKMQVVFGWAEPFIQRGLSALQQRIGWEPHLYPHWKHVFVLFWLYVGAYTQSHAQGLKTAKATDLVYRIEIPLIAFVGGLFGLLVGVACGTLDLAWPASNVLVVGIAAAGMALFELAKASIRATGRWFAFGYPWRGVFGPELRGSSFFGALAIAAIFLSLYPVADDAPGLNAVPGFALGLLFGLVVGIALHDIWSAKRSADVEVYGEQQFRQILERPSDDSGDRRIWRQAFFSRAQMGLLMLSAVGGSLVFLLTNAGLKFAGL